MTESLRTSNRSPFSKLRSLTDCDVYGYMAVCTAGRFLVSGGVFSSSATAAASCGGDSASFSYSSGGPLVSAFFSSGLADRRRHCGIELKYCLKFNNIILFTFCKCNETDCNEIVNSPEK